ncbi:MAG TPA: DUF488 domain-containing protein [Isosphaeraceae bacterium]|nr:DUF488 domain-containing protein [Isosphaeraceae bacterium]
MTRVIWTIGHSTRDFASFAGLLHSEDIALVADVRRFPGSRRYPQFNQESLASALATTGIGYRHYGELGGRRHMRSEHSPNTGWREEAFNAFADHTASPEFAVGLARLQRDAQEARTAIMCSEAVPWRCHRRLLADALIVSGWRVFDIIGPRKVEPHRLTEFARVTDGKITYPADPLLRPDDTE